MPGSDWERIAPASLPAGVSDDIQIVRNDTLANSLFGVNVPVLKCISFFPGKSPTSVLLALCDINRRVTWDVNYQPGEGTEKPAESTQRALKSLLTVPLKAMCHTVQLPTLHSIGFTGRLFCYDRLITPLRNPEKPILSLTNLCDSDVLGYSVAFRNKEADAFPHSQKSTIARMFFQQYIIRRVTRNQQTGTELVMTSCTDVSVPQYFPRALQNYISARFTTRAFLTLREYLEKSV
mmetsp:Transcript_38739/g.61368  ORF Transcript_38739/g.61368 Transcript_38739/m.61368 type:complete len:236 (-) Transcript_38739:12-719(-)